MLISDLILRVRDFLHDTRAPYRWSDAELLRWLSDAQRTTVTLIPESYIETRSVLLENSKFRQTIPADALRLLDITRNMGKNGTSPGPGITSIGRIALEAQEPNWTTTTGQFVEHFIYDFKTPRQFFIYPNTTDGRWVEMTFSKDPAEVQSLSETFVFDATYIMPMVYMTTSLAYAKDMDSPTSAAKARAYMDLYQTALGQNVQSTSMRVPKTGEESAT